jgi:hypothetical protein
MFEKLVQANFRISEDVVKELRHEFPRGRQSGFVEDAIVSALKRLKLKKAIKDSFKAWRGRRGGLETTEKFIRSLRQGRKFV